MDSILDSLLVPRELNEKIIKSLPSINIFGNNAEKTENKSSRNKKKESDNKQKSSDNKQKSSDNKQKESDNKQKGFDNKPKSSDNKKTKREIVGKGQLFGLISGTVTTIGVIVGLWQSHNNVSVIIAAIMSIALSDSFSDGFGMYFSQRTHLDITEARAIGLQTTFYKFLVTVSYIIPFLVVDINTAIQINIIWGCLLISYASYQIGEGFFLNLVLAMIVIFMSYLGGNMVRVISNVLLKHREQ